MEDMKKSHTGFTHLDKKGNAWMVDVSAKKHSIREAVAAGRVYMKKETITVYDMCKSADKRMVIGNIMLVKKTGGKNDNKEGNVNVVAKVIAINISEKKGVPKKTVEYGEFIENHGLKGDAHAGNWHRQVSFLGQESIDRMKALGVKGLCTGKFAENITTEGIELYSLRLGTRIMINDVIFEVTQIGKECHQKCAIFYQVGDCVMPKEGIFAKVIKGGIIKPGDEIIVTEV